jgi:hypothetical protein
MLSLLKMNFSLASKEFWYINLRVTPTWRKRGWHFVPSIGKLLAQAVGYMSSKVFPFKTRALLCKKQCVGMLTAVSVAGNE